MISTKHPTDYFFNPKKGNNAPSIWDWGFTKLNVPLYGKDNKDMVLVVEDDHPGYIAMWDIPRFSENFKKQTNCQRPKTIEDIINAREFHDIDWSSIADLLRGKKEQ